MMEKGVWKKTRSQSSSGEKTTENHLACAFFKILSIIYLSIIYLSICHLSNCIIIYLSI